jgi:hypothetical protein
MIHRSAWCLSLLLGQASTLLGVMITLGWTLAIAFVLPPRVTGWSAGPRSLLPIEPPLIGLAIAAVALWISRWSREPISRYALAGLVFNAVPLALALASIMLRWGY